MIGRPTLYTLVPWKTYTEIVHADSEARARHNADAGAKPLEHLIGWTVNDARKMKCLIRLGMTGILTDRPGRLRRVLDRARRRREAEGRKLGGRRIGLFSYGSGCCAEFFTGVIAAGVGAVADTGVRARLARRTLVDVPTYERLLHAAEQGGEPPADFDGDFVFRGVRNDRREYGRVREVLAA